MKKKRILAVALALVLVAVIGVGTLAYLSQKSDDVTNTFIAGTTKLIDPDPTDNTKKGFRLEETKVEYDAGAYILNTAAAPVTSNEYPSTLPLQKLPKDPTVWVNVATGASVYVFVKIDNQTAPVMKMNAEGTDATTEKLADHAIITPAVNDTDWAAVGASFPGVYYYKAGVVTGGTDENVYEIPGSKVFVGEGDGILKNGFVQVYNYSDAAQLPAVAADGQPHAGKIVLGDIIVTAYVCQSETFASAAAACEACFPALKAS